MAKLNPFSVAQKRAALMEEKKNIVLKEKRPAEEGAESKKSGKRARVAALKVKTEEGSGFKILGMQGNSFSFLPFFAFPFPALAIFFSLFLLKVRQRSSFDSVLLRLS